MVDENRREKCINGSRFRFVPDTMRGVAGSSSAASYPNSDTEISSDQYLALIANLLKPVYENYAAWTGDISPNEFTAPANSQRKRFEIFPAARTIRVECDVAAQIWFNKDNGVPIHLGGDRKAIYLSDLPPVAAIHDIYVTCETEARIFVLGVS